MEFKIQQPENRVTKDFNLEEMEYRLRIFLTEILKVKLDRGDIYATVHGLKSEYLTRLDAFGGLSDKEKDYIRKRAS